MLNTNNCVTCTYKKIHHSVSDESGHIDLQDSALTPKGTLNLQDCQYRISDSPFVMLGLNTYVLFSIPPFL